MQWLHLVMWLGFWWWVLFYFFFWSILALFSQQSEFNYIKSITSHLNEVSWGQGVLGFFYAHWQIRHHSIWQWHSLVWSGELPGAVRYIQHIQGCFMAMKSSECRRSGKIMSAAQFTCKWNDNRLKRPLRVPWHILNAASGCFLFLLLCVSITCWHGIQWQDAWFAVKIPCKASLLWFS